MTQKTTMKSEVDRLYYNMSLQNNTNKSVVAQFNATLPASILAEPDKYFMSVIRWSADGSSLPIMIFPDQTTDPLYVTISYNGVDYPQQVLYAGVQPEPPPGLGNVIYSYTAFAEMINTALAAAYGAIPGAPIGSNPPYMIYDILAERYYIVADQFYLQGLATPITIWMNSNLYYYFDNFSMAQFFGENGPAPYKDIQIPVIDYNGSNPGPIANTYKIMQETSALYRLFDLETIQFVSYTIPVRYEYTSGTNNTDQIFNAGSTGSGPPVVQLITDFIPTFTNANQSRDQLVYVPFGEYRLSDLLSQSSGIQKLDLQVFWTDRQNRQYPWLIPPKTAISVKIMFQKK